MKSIVTKIKDNLHTVCQQLVMKAKGNQLFLTYDINYTLDIYKDAFEWAIEFPEIISEKGTFLGFDCIIGNTYPLEHIAEAYDLFENRRDNVIKVAIK